MKEGYCRLIFVFLLVFLVCLGGVIAVKPSAQSSTGGLTIINPKFEYYPQATLKLHFHIFNSTGSNVNGSCNFHFYNNTGNHILENLTLGDSNNQEQYIIIDKSLLKVGASYSYLIWCNTNGSVSKESGFLSDGYYVNYFGDLANPNWDNSLAFIIAIPLIIAFLLMFIAHSLGEAHNILKIFLMLLSLVFTFVTYNFGVMVLVRFFNMTELQDAIGSNMYWWVMCFIVIIFYFFIYLIIAAFKTARKAKAEKLEY